MNDEEIEEPGAPSVAAAEEEPAAAAAADQDELQDEEPAPAGGEDAGDADIAALQADLEKFFGKADEEEPATAEEEEPAAAADEGEAAEAAEEEPAAAAAAPAEEPQRDAQGRLLDESGIPLNEYGLPDITDEEWNEFLEDETIPMAERMRDFQAYQHEMAKRKEARAVELAEARTKETTEVRTFVESLVPGDEGAALFASLDQEARKVLAHVPEAERLRPGYYDGAVRLVAAQRMDEVIAAAVAAALKKHGVAAPAAADAAGEGAAAPPSSGGGKAKAKARLAVAGGGEGGTPKAAAAADAGSHGLSAEELAMAKEFEMTPAEYAKYKSR